MGVILNLKVPSSQCVDIMYMIYHEGGSVYGLRVNILKFPIGYKKELKAEFPPFFVPASQNANRAREFLVG
jgi:hypothetical protein